MVHICTGWSESHVLSTGFGSNCQWHEESRRIPLYTGDSKDAIHHLPAQLCSRGWDPIPSATPWQHLFAKASLRRAMPKCCMPPPSMPGAGIDPMPSHCLRCLLTRTTPGRQRQHLNPTPVTQPAAHLVDGGDKDRSHSNPHPDHVCVQLAP